MNAMSFKFNLKHVDRRKEKRRGVLQSAKIIYGGLWGTIVNCLILNLSDNGARIETILTTDVPDFFYLEYNHGTTKRLVCKRWSSGHHIGVEFDNREMSP